MTESPHRVRVFVSSPGDVAEERVLAARLIRRLADEFADRAWVEPVFWEHEPLLATETFQSQIPRPSECQVMVCVLWSRIGTRLPAQLTRPDGTPYASGTEYEFEDAVEGVRRTGQPALLVYRKTARPLADLGDEAALLRKLDQKRQLDAFLNHWFHDAADGSLKAAFHPFDSSVRFEELLESHLRKLLTRRLPPPAAGPSAKPTWSAGSPFRGLQVFDFEHAPVFFGRSRAVADVLAALRKQAAGGRAFVLVLGGSGSGKSSLARAGVVPLLTQPGVIEGVGHWRRCAFRPSDAAGTGGDPFDALAAALLRPEALPELSAGGTTAADLANLLRENPAGATLLLKTALTHVAASAVGLALVADQLEELFTIDRISPGGRNGFVAALAALARCGRVWVVGTLRSDFYPRCVEVPDLVALKAGAGQYDLVTPEPPEIAQLVREPARAAGVRFEADSQTGQPLDDVLRDAALSSPECLPLLQFALEELYKRRTPDGVMTYAAYRELGGVEGALARRAEETFAALPPDVQSALPRVFRALVAVGSGEEAGPVRRKAPLAEVTDTPQEQAFADAFVAARLFTTDLADATEPAPARAAGGVVVSIAHEALLRHWPRLVQWLAADRELLRVRQRVSAAADRWSAKGRRADLLLPEGLPLAEAHGLHSAVGLDLSAAERAFIAASAARAAARRRIRGAAVTALAVLTVVAGAAAFYAERQRRRAAANERTATANAALADQQAGLADARRLQAVRGADDAARRLAYVFTREGWARYDVGDPLAALPWFARAVETAPLRPEDQAAARLRFAAAVRALPRLLDVPPDPVPAPAAVTADGRMLRIDGNDVHIVRAATGQALAPPLRHDAAVRAAAFSPDGRRVATGGAGGISRVWDAATGQPVTPVLQNVADVVSVAFSGDGSKLVTANEYQTARVWDAATGLPLTPPLRHEGDVQSAAFSRDGRSVVTASKGGSTRVWAATAGDPPGPGPRHDGFVADVAFSRDGSKLVTASADGTARVWDAATGRPMTPPLPHGDAVTAAAFSPDGERVATASKDKTARVWDAATGRAVSPPLRHEDAVTSVAFSPDGRRVVTASRDGTARVWDAGSGAALGAPLRHDNIVHGATFSPDGRRVLTASQDMTARIWDAATGQDISTMRHTDAVSCAVMSPDGRRVATAGWDTTARIWDAATGEPVATLRHEGGVVCVSFSPDGGKVVTGSDDHSARVWDAATGRPLTPPLGHDDRLTSASFSPDGRRVVSASWDGTARVWDVASGQAVTPHLRHAAGVPSASFSPDGMKVVTASHDRTARVWDLTPDNRPAADVRATAEVLAAQRLDATDAVVTLTAYEWRRRWDDLRRRYPDDFRPRPGPGAEPVTRPATSPAPAAAGTRPATRPASATTTSSRPAVPPPRTRPIR